MLSGSGSVDDYTEEAVTAIGAAIAREAGAEPSQVTVDVAAGSVVITATIAAADAQAAADTQQALLGGAFASAEAATALLDDATGGQLSLDLAAPEVQTLQTPVAAVAAGTPPPPPSPTPRPPAPQPPPPHPPEPLASQSSSEGSGGVGGVLPYLLVGVVLVCGVLIACWWNHRRVMRMRHHGGGSLGGGAKAIGAPVPTMLQQASASDMVELRMPATDHVDTMQEL